MSLRRPDPRGPMGERHGAVDPLADALIVRPAGSDDLPRIRDIVAGVLAEFGLAPDPGGTDLDLADLDLHYRRAGGEFWVVEDGRGRILGTCGVWPDPDDRARCELRKMYLLPEIRGRGLGRRLLELAVEHARRTGRSRMELETAAPMTAAMALYRSAGFVEMEERPHASRCDRKFALELRKEVRP